MLAAGVTHDTTCRTAPAGSLKDIKLTVRTSAMGKEDDEKQRRCVREKMTAEQRAAAREQA